jgi:hypothetical protein
LTGFCLSRELRASWKADFAASIVRGGLARPADRVRSAAQLSTRQ